MDITRWSIPKSEHVLSRQRWRNSIQSAKTRPGADCGSDDDHSIENFRLKLKKVGKTRTFRYDLNQIPHDYTLEVMNRFKGLDLVDSLPEELWSEVCNTTEEVVTKTIPKKKKCKKEKWLSEEATQIAEERAKGKRERERYTQLNAEFQRIARRDQKAFLNEQCKEREENNRTGKIRDLFKKKKNKTGLPWWLRG